MAASSASCIGRRLFRAPFFARTSAVAPGGVPLRPCFQAGFRRSFSLSSSRWATHSAGVSLRGGVPTLSVLLPSHGKQILFPLPLFSNRVGDLIKNVKSEDENIEKVQVLSRDGEQFSVSTSMNVLLQSGFQLVVDGTSYAVMVPDEVRSCVDSVDSVKNLVHSLHSTLGVAEQQRTQQESLQAELHQIRQQLEPLEEEHQKLLANGSRRANMIGWGGLAFMSFQCGFLARLTWWEYSWDIMEPVTYFVTYGTAIVFYAYYVVTREDFTNVDFEKRQYLFGLYSKLQKNKFDPVRYNFLKEEVTKLEATLEKVRSFPAVAQR